MDDDEALTKRANQERLLISRLSKEDLEDKYLKIYDENIILKKHARKQEDRIKKMATKLVRLVNDKKKSMNQAPATSNISMSSMKRGRDIDTEEFISELQEKISDLEQQNRRLKENLQVSKAQMQTLQAQKNPISNVYSNITARIDTGIPRRERLHHSPEKVSSFNRNIRTISTGGISARSNASLIQQNQQQMQELEYDNIELKSQLDEYQSEIDSLRTELHKQKMQYENEMSRLREQVSHDHVTGVQENIDQIRLQRELKDKANQYTELNSKYHNISQQHAQLKMTHDRLLDEIERFNQQLKQEQQKNIALRTEMKNLSLNNRELLELRERIEDLNRDNQVLKETNEKLLNSAFSLEREREFREREKTLKIQIAQLEATSKADVGEKNTILDQLSTEKEQFNKLNTDLREMQVKYYDMKQKYDDMNEKMQFLSKESNIDFSEIEEALIIVRDRRTNKHTDEFSHLIDSEKIKAYQRKLVNLEADLAETIGDLEKCRHLYLKQIEINKEYKQEVLLIQNKMEENKADYDAKMLEYAQLLDVRAAKIKKLEAQMKDILYGTKQVKIKPEDGVLTDANALLQKAKRRDSYSFVGETPPNLLDHYLTANLERGQNVFEIHITRVVLTEEAIHMMKENDPSTFCTIEFYEYELQTTPIVKGGPRVDYNFTSQYIVRVDDFFLHYLQKETSTIELHQAIGTDYETRAACQLSFRDLIDKQSSRIHGSARLLCTNSSNVGMTFGTVEYWVRLIVPVEEAFRQYKQKAKALGYYATNLKAADENDKKSSTRPRAVDNMNELNVNVLRCSKIASLDGKSQPSPYCVYKFFDFPDHDTEIIAASNFPEFNDHRSFAVHMDMDLDKYLKTFVLEVYVFDDNEAEDNGQYLGVAKIPLIELSHDRDIKGTFELKKADGKSNGTIDITLYWQYAYVPPSASTFSASGSKQPTRPDGSQKPRSSNLSLLPDESLDQSPLSMVDRAKKMGFKIPATTTTTRTTTTTNSKPASRKTSAAGVDNTNQMRNAPASAPQAAAQHAEPDSNELIVDVLRCSSIYGPEGPSQPPPMSFCMYQFYKSPEHRTRVSAASSRPEFNDQCSLSVRMDSELDKYLRLGSLDVFIFDQADQRQFLGVAKIPLIELSRDKDIIGSFDFKKVDGTSNGKVDISLHWQSPYRPRSRKSSDELMRQQRQVSSPPHSPINMGHLPSLAKKRVSIANSNADESVGASTIYNDDKQQQRTEDLLERPHAPSPPRSGVASRRSSPPSAAAAAPAENNPHLNDTMFGDEQPGESVSPNLLRHAYERKVNSDDEDSRALTENDAENEIDEDIEAYRHANDNNEDDENSVTRVTNNQDTAGLTDTQKSLGATDDIVVGSKTWDPNNTAKLAKEGNKDNVIIEITSFSLKEDTEILRREDIKRLFVSMEFLNYDPYDLESNISQPKPAPNQPAFFHFRKIFAVDARSNYDKRQLLAAMLVDKDKSTIRFAVVSDPETDEDCEEIGYAYLDVNDILKSKQNYENKELKLFDAANGKVQIGKMIVTVEILEALLAVKQELEMEQTI